MTLSAVKLLDQAKVAHHSLVSFSRVRSVVCAPMAVRANPDHKSRIVRSPVCQTTNVVCFEKWTSGWRNEWRRLFAVFAPSFRSCEDVVLDCGCPLINARELFPFAWVRACGGESAFSKIAKRDAFFEHNELLCLLFDSFDRPKLEDDCAARSASFIFSIGESMTSVDKLAFEEQARLLSCENQKTFAVFSVVRDRRISANKSLITFRPLAEILENSVIAHRVGVSVCSSILGADNENRPVYRIDYAGPFVPSEPRMNISAAVVCAAFLKTPGHSLLQLLSNDPHPTATTVKRRFHSFRCLTLPGVGPDFKGIVGTGGGSDAQDRPDLAFFIRDLTNDRPDP